ncbi:MAG: hypothetical protein J0L69_15575 [Bacteroidetes bacterium]|nr:hypothetical protein [Bacteroidota bacterium]
MWNVDSLWFEIAIVSIVIALGQILFGHFEERTPRAKKLAKYLLFLGLVVGISCLFGRVMAMGFLFIAMLPALYIHMIMLPRKGINGWTGEPKSKYYDYRKWDKDIFRNE